MYTDTYVFKAHTQLISCGCGEGVGFLKIRNQQIDDAIRKLFKPLEIHEEC